MHLSIIFIAILCLPITLWCVKGVDYSIRVTNDSVECLYNNSYRFAIIRGYLSRGSVDPNIVANLKDAWDGGMKYVDVYIFPCVPCGNPKGQIDTLLKGLENSKYERIWIDVEPLDWKKDMAENQKFILDMIDELEAKNKTIGIYTNLDSWRSIVGVDWNGTQNYTLWYGHHDNNASFSDFSPFGGWTDPMIKQYTVDAKECNVSIGLDYYHS